MFDFTKPNIEILEISEDKRFGRFVCEPLERGYGSTLGNSLRRMMLSSLPGAAISAIKIENLSGDKVSGIQEGFPELLTNLKSIAVILPEEVESLEVSVDLSGKSEILAEDFIGESELKLSNPTEHIATVEAGAQGSISLFISRGQGYSGEKAEGRVEAPKDYQDIDALYTPVERVNMSIENTRVGNMTDYDRLTLDVYTNGSMSPEDAISKAAQMLFQHLDLFVALSEEVAATELMVDKPEDEKGKVMEMNIDELELSVRSYNCLKRAGINTVSELTSKTPEDMMKVRNLGRKSLEEVLAKLRDLNLGLSFPEE